MRNADISWSTGPVTSLETDGVDATYASYSKPNEDSWYMKKADSTTYPDMHANLSNVTADLTSATSATINQLRLAFATQKFLEIQARGGSRYIEVIKNHFNVTSPDARLQRPEFLGSGSSPINISPVAQTSSTDSVTPQGNLSAIGTTVMSNVQHGNTTSYG